ncbi:CheR family methyltransferase [Sporolactobacillus spathodeae]|uniref:protein-glutamate O-methyltransferase n=2 Tax=Sporolactobacillus spathodeae TaxID=1465502 RepID=A0ABS2Q9Q0_9BACL|nr:protein-glutamate O-methyltransferase CheR [Sporolactobacillus spathodeae]MBM7658170.1 chemotaxis protein methyltransferase CheR [Sporolactobacillus spathodeae]
MAQGEDRDYQQFKESIFHLTNINLSYYKEDQMRRRLNTLRLKKEMPSFVAYFQAMQQSDALLKEFLSRMTINVTEFFRNRSRWTVLEEKIKKLSLEKRRISIWSAACSTGEEPYSLSMLLRRYFPAGHFSITATDIDREVLAKAETGTYIEQALVSLTAEERQLYISQTGLLFQVNPALKAEIQFIQHDLLNDDPPGRFDIVVCRNVLIYFTEEGKQVIYHKISQSLEPKGILFVGSTEQIFHPENYQLVSAEPFFYQKGFDIV